MPGISDENMVGRVVMPKSLRKEADLVAKRDGRSFSNYVCNLIRKDVSQKLEQQKKK